MAIEIPPRVAFLNIKDGNVFFDCSPAEARVAKQLVERMRTSGDFNIDYVMRFKDSIKKCVDTTLKAPVDSNVTLSGVTATFIADNFKKIEEKNARVSHVVMRASEYAWLRSWDRDCMDMVTDIWMLKAGVMALMWGAYVVVSKEVPERSVIFAAMEEDEPILWRAELTYDKDCGYSVAEPDKFHTGSVERKLDRILALLDKSEGSA